MTPDAAPLLAIRLRRQAAWCAELGSPLYASLLESAADDLELEGPVWGILKGFEEEPGSAALALRFMGAVHRLVLDDTLPELVARYPSTGGDGDPATTWPVFRQGLIEHRSKIRALLDSGCQTNEVGRSAALLGEIGASAGLNLRWDRYRYESTGGGWGDDGSPVRFTHSFQAPPPMNRTATVIQRRGCDLNPIDPASDEGALTLRSFIWADQLGRLALLDGAIEIARATPVEVVKADAADFLETELAGPAADRATVVYHSVFMQYVDEPGRRRIQAAIARSQAQSAPDAPVFHLRLEPAENVEARLEIRLNDELLGTSLAHGSGVRWVVDSTAL